jgi:peptide-methionine (S)-S-oxide reductase
MEKITLGAGCFWCVEAIFQGIKGVESVVSGYSGGEIKNPSYREVCAGTTGHAEVCQLTYNPEQVSFHTLLEVFWQTHDPTTINRQGEDVGTQYRSAIFYHTKEQQQIAQTYLTKLNDAGAFENPIVTEITEYTDFYSAENYHQDYFNLNGEQPYCSTLIRPKLEKFKKDYSTLLK